MAKKTSSLFLKYFWDFFIIMLSFIIIITVLLSYFVFNYTSTSKNLYRTKATEQSNQLISNVFDSCTNIFASVASDENIAELRYMDMHNLSEIARYNKTIQINKTLSNQIINNDYISSIYVCSFENNYIISNQNFKMTEDFSDYIWYNEDLLIDQKTIPFTTSTKLNSNGDTEYIILYRSLDNNNPLQYMCIIVLNARILKNNISDIFYDNDCSFLIWDNQNNTPVISTLPNKDQIAEIHENSLNNKKPSFFSHSQSSKLFSISDYNWDCTYVYDNTVLNREIFQTLCLIVPLSFVILFIIAVLLSYMRAKRAYLPINKMISELSKQKNNINMQDIIYNYQYTELNYISEMLIDTIQDKQKLQEELAKNLKQLNDANKYALEVQIQPHFIFNTLEIIYLQSYELFGDKNIISEMVYNLSDILRVTLRNDNKFMPINSEIDYIKKYMYIQNIRFGALFETSYDIDENSENLMTPKLILQPIVENSIVHGIIPSEKKCFIKISNVVKNDRVVFTIEDNGIGMSEERLKEIRKILNNMTVIPNKNIGIANVNMRIKLLFGNEYGCSIISSDSNGTKIEISIPVITS